MIEHYLSEKQKRKRKRRRYVWYGILILFTYAVLWGIAWVVVRSPLFRVDHIVVTGTNDVPQAAVVSLLQASVLNKGDSISAPHSGIKAIFGFTNMLIWPSSLPASDLAAIPQLESIRISKDYFSHTITAAVTEKQPFGIWCLSSGASGAVVSPADTSNASSIEDSTPTSDESCYWFDDQGIVFERGFDTQGSLLSVVHDHSQTSLALLAPVLPEEFVPNLISIMKVIRASGVAVQSIDLNDLSLEQINVTTVKGPALYFSLRFPADDDLPVLQSLMAKPNFSKLQYVDFTVENRAFYK